jgi:hypothetical protein
MGKNIIRNAEGRSQNAEVKAELSESLLGSDAFGSAKRGHENRGEFFGFFEQGLQPFALDDPTLEEQLEPENRLVGLFQNDTEFRDEFRPSTSRGRPPYSSPLRTFPNGGSVSPESWLPLWLAEPDTSAECEAQIVWFAPSGPECFPRELFFHVLADRSL